MKIKPTKPLRKPHSAKVFVFNKQCEVIDEGMDKEIAKKYGIKHIRHAIREKALVQEKYYFALHTDFVKKEKKKYKRPPMSEAYKEKRRREKIKKQLLEERNKRIPKNK